MARKISAHSRCAHVRIGFVTIFAVSGAMAANNTSTTKPAIANYARPISFEPNRGQTNKQVDFLAHGAGYTLFLSHAKAVMVLQRGAPAKPNSNGSPIAVSSATIHMKPVGGNASAKVEALGQLPGKSNYFVGSVPERWHSGIPNYAKVRYGNVYPGVDMIYYGNQRQLEYDFVVSPGADPGRILVEFQGASKAELDQDGNVVMHTSAGDVRWHKPVAYQELNGSRKLVACAYARSGADRLRFALDAYDRTKPLIIDPVLAYSTYLGGSGGEDGNGIALDANGNAYVTGTTGSTDFPIKRAFQAELKGTGDALVTKFDRTGNLVYSTYLGGTGGDGGDAIAVDAHGNAYITGRTDSIDFPTKNALQNTLKGLSDVFVTKLDADGNALYSTYLGGSGSEPSLGGGIAVDAQGNAYITGTTGSPDFPTKNAFQNELKGEGFNAFVTKLDDIGSLVYSTYLGGTYHSSRGPEEIPDWGIGIAVDANGSAYVTGLTGTSDFPTKNAFQAMLRGFGNAFVTKFEACGCALVYSTYLGGSSQGSEVGYGIAVDADGNAYVTGVTGSTDFPIKNAFQETLNGGADAFVTKFDPLGNLAYSTYWGEPGTEWGRGIAVDADGDAYVTGASNSRGGDVFVIKLDATGDALVYSTYLGGSGDGDIGNGIAVDTHGNAYVTGSTNSPDFPTKHAFQATLVGSKDAFVAKIRAHPGQPR